MGQKRTATNVVGTDICVKCEGRLVRDEMAETHDERRCLTCGRVTYIKNSRGYDLASRRKKRAKREATVGYWSPAKVRSRAVGRGNRTRKKNKVKEMVMQYGVNITADMVNMPRSTVGLWTKGLSNKPTWAFNRGKYSKEFKTEVAEYAIRAKNYYYTAKKYQISRGTVQNWVKEYKLHKGEGWLSK
jgi:hypothetical protein